MDLVINYHFPAATFYRVFHQLVDLCCVDFGVGSKMAALLSSRYGYGRWDLGPNNYATKTIESVKNSLHSDHSGCPIGQEERETKQYVAELMASSCLAAD